MSRVNTLQNRLYEYTAEQAAGRLELLNSKLINSSGSTTARLWEPTEDDHRGSYVTN